MLVVAVAMMGTFLLSWSNSSFAAQRLQIANTTSNRINLINESFVLEDVWFYQSGGTTYANVTIRNTGDLAIKISKVYINNTEKWSGSESITIGSSDEVKVTTSQIVVGSGKPQSIWVKTERGSEVKQIWKS